jgi:sugar (pentulose or hexulose) kinase
MSRDCAIGVDVGTSGVRAVLVDAACAPLARGEAPLPADRLRDPQAWWAALEVALTGLRHHRAIVAVGAIAVDGTSGTVLPVDGAGAPVGLALMYNDPADPLLVQAIKETAPAESGAHGATSALARAITLQGRPNAARILHQADWIAGQLCGRFDTTDENNALKTGYDPVARAWPDWLGIIGMRMEMLPRVVAPGTELGELRRDLARAFGLSDGVRIVAGTTDGCASFLATGAGVNGTGVTALGSTLTLKLLSDRPVFAPAYGIYSHRLGESWLPGGASNSGGAVLALFFTPAQLRALSERIDPSKESDCDFYPLTRPGERFPLNDPTLQPRLEPRPGDDVAFLHGLLEGIARVEALGYRRLEELGAPSVTQVLTVGGGAANRAWMAIRARVLGVKVEAAGSADAALGAARLALRAT